jgi:hypothetical protein
VYLAVEDPCRNRMAFSFGSATPAPAPSGGGFSFGSTGSSAPTPASGGFSFGSSSSGPAATFGPAPATGGFGSPSPAPAFGSTPAPAFGSTPAPAFGSTTPAPSSGFGFASNPAPAPFGSPAPAPFGTPAGQPQAQQEASIAGSTQYSDLSPQYRQIIDNLHEKIIRHKRIMINVQSTAPALLVASTGTPLASTSQPPSLTHEMAKLQTAGKRLQQDLEQLHSRALQQKEICGEAVTQAFVYGKIPIETVATRRGVRLSVEEEKKDTSQDTQQKVRDLLDGQAAYVDRVERIPSPFLWQTIEDIQHRLANIQEQAHILQSRLALSLSSEPIHVSSTVEYQHITLSHLTQSFNTIHHKVDEIRTQYRWFEKNDSDNVLEKSAREERSRQRSLDEKVQLQFLRASGPTPGAAPATTVPAPTSAYSFGGTSSASTPASSSFSFSNSSLPAPAFGAPSPAHAFGAPAPTPGGSLFGSTAPAPSNGGFSFGGTTSAIATPKKKSSSRSGRLGR